MSTNLQKFIRGFYGKDVLGQQYSLQTIGGFKIPEQDEVRLEELKPVNVFERLNKISTNNLLAISELNVNGEYNVNEAHPNLLNVERQSKIEEVYKGLTQDLGFINKAISLDPNKKDDSFLESFRTIVGRDGQCMPSECVDTKEYHQTVTNKGEEEQIQRAFVVNVMGLNIMNVHFDSEGPGEKTIDVFLTDTFTQSVDPTAPLPSRTPPVDPVPPGAMLRALTNIHVICGDTNIAEDKVKVGDEKEKRGEKIAAALNNITAAAKAAAAKAAAAKAAAEGVAAEGVAAAASADANKRWIVIMSKITIKKIRSGFVINNQQPHKTQPSTVIPKNADGTMIAIVSNDIQTDIEKLKPLLPPHYTISSEGNKTVYGTGGTPPNAAEGVAAEAAAEGVAAEAAAAKAAAKEEKDALRFETDLKGSVGDTNNPVDKVFIDHSVLHMPLIDIIDIVKPRDPVEFSKEQSGTRSSESRLVVLNLGSMVNVGNKSWTTEKIGKQRVIDELDEKLYAIFKELTQHPKRYDELDKTLGAVVLNEEQQEQLRYLLTFGTAPINEAYLNALNKILTDNNFDFDDIKAKFNTIKTTGNAGGSRSNRRSRKGNKPRKVVKRSSKRGKSTKRSKRGSNSNSNRRRRSRKGRRN